MRDIVRDKGYLTLGSRFRRLGERLQAEVQQLAHDVGIDVPSSLFTTLDALDAQGHLTIGELALTLGISQPGATRIVNQLRSLGLIESQAPEKDRRVRRIALTRKSKVLVQKAKAGLWPRVEKVVAQICTPLEGNLLEMLAAIEAALDEKSLLQRAAKSKTGKMK